MKCCFLLLFVLALSYADEIQFDAFLDGNNQNPPVISLGEGYATFTYNTDSRKLSWDIDYNFLQSGVTGAHIHGPSEIEDNNPTHIIDLEIKEGSTDGSLSGSEELTRDHGEMVKNGLTYVNIHTSAHPDGEVRGQILTTEKYFIAYITGSQQAPTPVLDTDSEGTAHFSIDYATRELSYQVDHDIDDATGIHIHGPARVGQNADPIILFDETKKSFSGTHLLSEQQVTYLRSGLLYINIHSEEHPDGEIRGQILVDEDGSSVGDDDWWIYGLIFLGLVFLAVLISVLAVVVYKKKGDDIRKAISSSDKTAEVNASLVGDIGVSNEPLLADTSSV